MKRLKISDIFNFTTYSGTDWLFNVFNSSSGTPPERDYPLLEDIVTDDNENILNEDYFFIHSADKYLSPFAQRLWEEMNEDEVLFFQTLVPILYNRFGVKWKKIYDALMTSYKPLENYSMEEEISYGKKNTHVNTEKVTTDIDGTNDVKTDSTNGIYGFNSNQSNPSNDVDGSSLNTIDNTEVVSRTGDITDTLSGKDTHKRSGNIGVTTSQQMLESEIKLRQYDFYNQIYDDIDSVLCLRIY